MKKHLLKIAALPRQWQELSWLVLAMLFTTPWFWLTDLDDKVAAHFYHPESLSNPWPEQDTPLFRALYDYTFSFAIVVASVALLLSLLALFYPRLRALGRPARYIALLIAIGPGLVVNLGVKDHWGRPRPLHTQEFGGQFQYLPPLQIGHTPDKSFVCGHCSIGASFVGWYFLANHYRYVYLLLSIGLTAMLGFMRMTSGSHFLSDILWSFYLVFLTAYVLHYAWYRKTQPLPSEPLS